MNNETKKMAQGDATIALFQLILDAMEEAIKNGIDAKEVWLGPFELCVLQRDAVWHLSWGLSPRDHDTKMKVIRGDIEGCQIMGLRVRAAVSDGVRVGTSYAGGS